jgi:hypothetical protein
MNVTTILSALALIFPVMTYAASDPAVCQHLPGTPEELAATPRTDENLEAMALDLSSGITAETSIYERLVRDVSVIRALEPRVGNIRYADADDGHTLLMMLEGDPLITLRQLERDPLWRCLNSHYRPIEVRPSFSGAQMKFSAHYNLHQLGELYSSIDGIKVAYPNGRTTIGNDADILVTRDAQLWHYVFVAWGRQCTPECAMPSVFYFIVDASGAARLAGTYNFPAPVAGTALSARPVQPEWLATYWSVAQDKRRERRVRENAYRP